MMKNKKSVIIPIEISQRELVAKCLFSLRAAISGYRVYIGEMESCIQLSRLAPEKLIFFHKSMWSYSREIKRNGHLFFIFDEEMGFAIHPKKVRESCIERWKNISNENTDLLFVANKEMLDGAKLAFDTKTVPAVISGPPQFDLYRPEMFGLHTKINPLRIEKYTLFISSYGGNNLNCFINENREFQKSTISDNEANLERLESLKVGLPMLRRFAELLKKNRQFLVIRPHNDENPAMWEQIFKDFDNVFVDRSPQLGAVICHSDLVIHASSTVAFVASMLGKKPIALAPKGQMKSLEQCQCSDVVDEFRELADIYASQKSSKMIFKESRWLENKGIPRAHEVILRHFDFQDIPHQTPIRVSRIKRITEDLKRSRRMWAGTLGKPGFVKNQKTPWIRYFEKLNGGITFNDVSAVIGDLAPELALSPKEFLIQTIYKGLYSLELK